MSHLRHDRETASPDHVPLSSEHRLFRTRNWLGQERVGLRYEGRRYLYRTLDEAIAASERLSQRRPARRRSAFIALLVFLVLLGGIGVWQYPPLLLGTVDLVRGIVGPAPIAYAETAVFRVGTLIRQARVQMGDTAPRWTVQGAQASAFETSAPIEATAAPTSSGDQQMTTTQPVPSSTAAPMPTVTATSPAPTVAPTARPTELAVIARGGNLRNEPLIDESTVVGLVWPGDTLAVIEQQQDDQRLWLLVELIAPAEQRGGDGVARGTVGWISGALLTPEPTATPTPIPQPTEPLLLAPTPITPTPEIPPTATPMPVPIEPVVEQPVPAPQPGDWPLAPLPVAINDGQVPNEGQWQLLPTKADGGTPAMAVTAYRPDPARPDIQVAVVAIDLARARLHMLAGAEEPVSTDPAAPRSGRIPDEQRGSILAAFNGGFKSIHGNDGMGVSGTTYVAPVNNRATVVVMQDGSVRLGLWNRDFTSTDGMAAWRQNGHLLIDGGQITERARQGGLGWGASLDLQAETWRSGIGISADGRTLFYAVGDVLTSARLAEVMRAAGASSALQLDINNYWVRFVTFQQNADGKTIAQPLISAMPREPGKYLGVEPRDFMYLTVR